MLKQKLMSRRKEKGLSQADIADQLGMEQSQYSRRESGTVQITKREWDKLAQVLDTKLEDIYEPEDGVYVINNEVASGEYSGSHNFFNIPNDLWEITQKYIKKLEEENQRLREHTISRPAQD